MRRGRVSSQRPGKTSMQRVAAERKDLLAELAAILEQWQQGGPEAVFNKALVLLTELTINQEHRLRVLERHLVERTRKELGL